jgi:hypothetical protein
LGLINKVLDRWYDFTYKIKRVILTVTVDVYPNSPHYPAYTTVTGVLLKRYHVPLKKFKTPIVNNQVDIPHIFKNAEYFHTLRVHYPERWWESIEEEN